MKAVADTMQTLMFEVASAQEWQEAIDGGQRGAERDAHEGHHHAILNYTEGYQGFEKMVIQAEHGETPDSLEWLTS